MDKYCRLCLSMTSEHFYEINNSEYQKQLETVIPELNIKSIQAPLLCQKCSKLLEAAYKLKTHSLLVDEYLSVFVDVMKTDVVPISEILNIKTELDQDFNTATMDDISIVDIQETEENNVYDKYVDLTESLPNSVKDETENDLVITLDDDVSKENHSESEHNRLNSKKSFAECHENIKFEVVDSDSNSENAYRKDIECVICGEKFDTYRKLRGHTYNYHIKIHYADFAATVDDAQAIAKPFACKVCRKRFTAERSLQDHVLMRHSKAGRKSCLSFHYNRHRKMCNKRFPNTSDLRKHGELL